jgi:hypothetical protein
MKIEVDAGAVALTPAKLIAKEARDAVANRGKLVMAVRGASAVGYGVRVSSASQPICQNSDQRLSPS